MAKQLPHHHLTYSALIAILILIALLVFGLWLFVKGNIFASESPVPPDMISVTPEAS